MPICVFPPIVKVYEDFDKMNANEISSAGPDNETNDPRTKQVCQTNSLPIGMKFDSGMDHNSSCCESNDEDSSGAGDNEKPKRLQRKLSDGTVVRRRSTSNLLYKCNNKSCNDTHTQQINRKFSNNSAKPSLDDVNKTKLLQITAGNCCTATAVTNNNQQQQQRLDISENLRKQLIARRTPSPSHYHKYILNSPNLCPGYAQYQMSFLSVPLPKDYGDASSDDLSSEWDSDVAEPQRSPKVFIFLLFV